VALWLERLLEGAEDQASILWRDAFCPGYWRSSKESEICEDPLPLSVSCGRR
jgi:hypothetical protein